MLKFPNEFRDLFSAAPSFSASFLLFLVEPIAAKQLLPALGGSAAVWITCLVFFQTALLLAYLYAHWFAQRSHWILHFLFFSCRRLCHRLVHSTRQPELRPSHRFHLLRAQHLHRPSVPHARRNQPAAAGVARPHSVWRHPLASLRALQPGLSARPRALPNARRALLYSPRAAAHLVLRLRCLRPRLRRPDMENAHTLQTSRSSRAAAGTTNRKSPRPLPSQTPLGPAAHGRCHATERRHQLISPPTSPPSRCSGFSRSRVYLVTLILAFQFPRFLPRAIITRFLVVMLAGLAYMLSQVDVSLPIRVGIAFFLVEVFISCLFCHTEAYALRPKRSSESTLFYLLFAAGGALGSFLIGIASPLIFSIQLRPRPHLPRHRAACPRRQLVRRMAAASLVVHCQHPARRAGRHAPHRLPAQHASRRSATSMAAFASARPFTIPAPSCAPSPTAPSSTARRSSRPS